MSAHRTDLVGLNKRIYKRLDKSEQLFHLEMIRLMFEDQMVEPVKKNKRQTYSEARWWEDQDMVLRHYVLSKDAWIPTCSESANKMDVSRRQRR